MKKLLIIFLVAIASLASLLSPTKTLADDSLCSDLFFEKNWERALVVCQKSAEEGSGNSQNTLAGMYNWGFGVKQDAHMAFELYLKSANNGNVHAQSNVAGFYATGTAVPKNKKLAFEWFLKAAKQGKFPYPQYHVGIMYLKGDGVEKSPENAVIWFEKAANLGNEEAQRMLAIAYDKGNGIKRDNDKAIFWYKRAANQGNTSAQSILVLKLIEKKEYKNAYKWVLILPEAERIMDLNRTKNVFRGAGVSEEKFREAEILADNFKPKIENQEYNNTLEDKFRE